MNTLKEVFVYNPSERIVNDFTFNGVTVTIEDNQIKGMPEDVADALIENFPYLIKQDTTATEAVTHKMIDDALQEKPKSLSPQEQFEKGFEEGIKHFCSMCGRDFTSDKGLKIHISHSHES